MRPLLHQWVPGRQEVVWSLWGPFCYYRLRKGGWVTVPEIALALNLYVVTVASAAYQGAPLSTCREVFCSTGAQAWKNAYTLPASEMLFPYMKLFWASHDTSLQAFGQILCLPSYWFNLLSASKEEDSLKSFASDNGRQALLASSFSPCWSAFASCCEWATRKKFQWHPGAKCPEWVFAGLLSSFVPKPHQFLHWLYKAL